MPEVQQEQQQPVENSEGLSDEQIIAKAMGEQPAPAGERQRDDKGRFAPQGQDAQAPAAEAAAEPPAEQAEAPGEQEAAQDEYKWDDLKNIKLKIPMKNGEKEWEEELSLEDLRNQRMMHSDYMARRREMDEQARGFESKQREAVEKERHAYLTSLGALEQSIIRAAAPELENVDWSKLAQDSPAEYVRLSNRAAQVNAALERVRFEQEKVQHQQATERQTALAKAVAESKAKVGEAIPNFDTVYPALLKRGVDSYGFKPEEVGQVWDHRVIQVLHDAHQFRLLQEGKKAAEQKVSSAAPVLKPGAQKPKVDPGQQKYQQAKERLRSNGKDDDAAAAVMSAFLTPRPQGRAQ